MQTYLDSKKKSYLKYLEKPHSPGLDLYSNEMVQRKAKYYLSHKVGLEGTPHSVPTVDHQVGGSVSLAAVPEYVRCDVTTSLTPTCHNVL